MVNTSYFKGKRILIVGCARSGLTCAVLLSELGAFVRVTDNQDTPATRDNAQKLSMRNIPFELGSHTREFVMASDLVVVSPGVPGDSQAVVWAKEQGLLIVSEIEIAGILCPATIIAVTGSNGKTTVTTLIGKILEAQGKRVHICGNIGNPFTGEVGKMIEGDFVALEVSSFQLERIKKFKPHVALILNFTRNHLDRHKDMDEYLAAKKRIFMNQDSADYLVLNADDGQVESLGKEARAQVIYFERSGELNPNQSAVLAVGKLLGIERGLIMGVLRDFKGVEHRMEYTSEINRVGFINDSKSTTVDATIWALKSLQKPVILIAGGREKGNDYSLIAGLVKEKVKKAILIGEAQEKIRNAFESFVPVEYATSLKQAVMRAAQEALPGECVLFSPMCKSFDMFLNYEDRGRQFKALVNEMEKESLLR